MLRTFILLTNATLFLGTSLVTFGQAPPRRNLSLTDAISGAIAQSKALRSNMADQGIAAARLQQARNGQLPSLGVNANYTRISNNVQPFSLSLPGMGDFVLNPQILNQSYNNVQLRQVIWSGGRVRQSILAGEREAQATQLDANQYRLAAADNVTTIWYTMYLLNASERVIRQNIRLLQDQYRDLQNQEKQGIVLKNDGLKLALAISDLESSLIDIQSGRAINNVNMATALAEPINSEYTIDSTALQIAPDALGLADYLTEAMQNRTEVKALSMRREAAVIGQRIVAANRLPTLSLAGSYDYNRPNQRVFPLQPDFKGTWSAGVTLSLDVAGLYTNKARETEARYGIDRLTTAVDQLRDGITMEVNTSFQTYQQARDKIRVAQKSIEQATENFRVEQNRLRFAATTPTDFLIANTQLVQAQLALQSAQANAELAHWKLLKSVGRINQ